jgi:hypothetical protein
LKPIADIPNQQAAEAMAAQQGQSSNPEDALSSTNARNKSICGTISLVASEAWYGLDLFSRSQGASASGAQFATKSGRPKWMKPASAVSTSFEG